MDKERKIQAQNIFEIPEDLRKTADKMLSDQEYELILLMQDKEMHETQKLEQEILDAGVSEKPAVLIQSAYSRGVVDKKTLEDGTKGYVLSNFYRRYPMFAQYEQEAYYRLSRQEKDRLNEWDFEVYYGIYGPDVAKKKQGINTWVHNHTYLTLEESDFFIDRHKDSIYVIPCNCKCMMDVTGKPRDVCLNFYMGENSEWDRGHGRRLTPEYAKELVRYWNSQGLMQNGEDYAICNCDGESCYPIQMGRKAGSQHVYPTSRYVIHWDEEKCISCGKCTRICNFGAFSRDENKKVHFNPDKCWGCTICTENCPKGALTRTEKEGSVDFREFLK